MDTPSLIALYSPCMGSGKSEVANHLVNAHGYTLVKFADPLKDMARALFRSMGYDGHDIERMVEGDLKETSIRQFVGVTPRVIMQTLGTEWGRNSIQDNFWVELAMLRAQEIVDEGGKVVIDDMRFINEYRDVKRFPGAIKVRVTRLGAIAYRKHPSEGLLDDCTFEHDLKNNAGLVELYAETNHIVSGYQEAIDRSWADAAHEPGFYKRPVETLTSAEWKRLCEQERQNRVDAV